MPDTEDLAANHPVLQPSRVTLTDRVIVRITGPGTDRFLQGQFSQQMADVTPGRSPRAAACTPKGRAYCLTRLVREGDDILMELPANLADDIITHLRKYLMLFRGTSMAIEADARIFGLLGYTAAEQLFPETAAKLVAPDDSMAVPGGQLVRTMDTAEALARYELWQTGELDGQLQQALDRLRESTVADWHASEIAAGVAALTPQTQEGFVPQMLNWQHLGGVHFKKGCYTGQEVIARMHFLGQLKKSLFRFTTPQIDQPPAPGDAVVDGDRTVGTVINSVAFTDGHCELLAVVRHDAAGLALAPAGAPDAALTLLPLPYPVPEREQVSAADT